MKKLILTILLGVTAPAFALLAPLEQSVTELEEVFQSPELIERLPATEKILSVDTVSNGYLLRTQNYTLFVQVVYESQTRPGPAQFRLIFHEPAKIQL